MNVVTLVGRLGQDPDNRMTENGTAVCNLSIATNRIGKGKETDWHKVVLWGKAAEVGGQYLRKGSEVAVTGSIQYRSWCGKDGRQVKVCEIHCNQLDLIGSKMAESAPYEQQGRTAPPSDFSNDNDVPF